MPENKDPFYALLRRRRHTFRQDDVVEFFRRVSRKRVESMAVTMSKYLSENLPAAFKGRETLPDYRANPYVLMTSASVMKLNKPLDYARFLFNNKLYMALETSFGKSFGIVLSHYPTKSRLKWEDPPEKRAEHKALAGRTREQKARLRTESVWREIDKSVVVGNRRYLTSIKSGPNTINDSTAQAMASAIIANHRRWADQTRVTYPNVSGLDVVIGLTYGTDRTTNNKENQILVKLLERGFEEEDHAKKPGVLIDGATQSTRVYRKIGAEFWAFVGDPGDPTSASFVFLEILLALAKALSTGIKTAQLEDRINTKIQELRNALASLQFQRNSLPGWLREDFSEEELFWFATAMTAFYDEGV